MQRLWTNPIKPKFCLSQSLASFCSPVCVIFQAISLNMCFGFSKTPPSRRERWQSGNNAHCWTRVLVFGCTVRYIYAIWVYHIYRRYCYSDTFLPRLTDQSTSQSAWWMNMMNPHPQTRADHTIPYHSQCRNIGLGVCENQGLSPRTDLVSIRFGSQYNFIMLCH